MTLTILSVAYALAPVHPAGAGGARQILGQLDSALVEAGHSSIVVACKGSSVSGTLVESACLPKVLDETLVKGPESSTDRQSHGRSTNGQSISFACMALTLTSTSSAPAPPALISFHLTPQWYKPQGHLRSL
jgi:hypothetical protein